MRRQTGNYIHETCALSAARRRYIALFLSECEESRLGCGWAIQLLDTFF